MNNKIKTADTEYVSTGSLAQVIETMVTHSSTQRRSHERKWYDNNFFDDGYHFRYLSRTTGKIVDLTERPNLNIPQRALPKASRQIRGIANLLVQPEFRPVIYPEKTTQNNYSSPEEFMKQQQQAKNEAKKVGMWVSKEWETQQLIEKMILMVILAAKNSVSFMQIWVDDVDNKLISQVYDAFDIYLLGNLTDVSDSPYIIKGIPQLINKILANERFDETQLLKLKPDNKMASSEIKEAYMKARYGGLTETDAAATIIQKEAFIKEYLTKENWKEAIKKGERNGAMEGKSKGDMVMRHAFTAGGVWLLDEYVALDDYPFVSFTFEPGALYQKPLIENFIPINKTLDIIVSRIERYINTMVSGTWLLRRGEDIQISNIPGGQKIEYDTTPPVQAAIQNVPASVFSFIEVLNGMIEEQGASTSALAQIPQGVKSGIAIESIKTSEYANLKIATIQLKNTIEKITEKMIQIGADYMVNPQTVYEMKEGEPDYFEIMGQRGFEIRQQLGQEVTNVVPIKKDIKVNVEVETGLGFTVEGQKQTMQQISMFLMQLAEQGYISQDAVKVVLQKFLETYQFGATQEIMEAMDSGLQSAPLNEDQMAQMKIAVAEVMKDLGLVGQQAEAQKEKQLVDSTKVGVVQAVKDMGKAKNVNSFFM